ncbi:MAG: polysaccharide deacetylase family protein [Hyphomicrobiaceae bacterium]|nr:polysaccharide deacetylase family protein [Hyphomicrobiaceae bacterium]
MHRATTAALTLLTGLVLALPSAHTAMACPGNPDALGVSRTVEIDTTGGPAFGLEQYKVHDFLEPGEVVLTFDDGPWPQTTKAVIDALAAHCTKATFFIIGKHAIWHPDILKQVARGGHTIGTHTWSHGNLSKLVAKKDDSAKAELEKGISAVKLALGEPPAPFFRFPFLQDPKEMVAYTGERNLAVFSMDLDSFDFKHRSGDAVVKAVMEKLAKKGKGIILMHDFQKSTAAAMPELLKKLKAGGYKVVHMKARDPAISLAEYDEVVSKEFAGPVANARPTSSVVRTITGN